MKNSNSHLDGMAIAKLLYGNNSNPNLRHSRQNNKTQKCERAKARLRQHGLSPNEFQREIQKLVERLEV